ncbi:nucleotidyltransferase domain-containing protein [Candidatus Margulisiibacteriota bacterium]
MNVEKDKILYKYISELRSHFKDRLKNILLFGSRARGEGSAESDYDCILLFEKYSLEDEKIVSDIENSILLDDFILFSSFAITLEQFEKRKYEPFIMNAKKEGIYLK